MIYTIGYAKLTLADLKRIVVLNNMIVIDVRAKPVSRKSDFNRKKLEAELGSDYQWHGDTLGGKGQEINQQGLMKVAAIRGKHPLLMCVEEAPGECHRHEGICHPHFPKAIHIYRDQLIQARQFQDAIDADEMEYFTVGTMGSNKKIIPD